MPEDRLALWRPLVERMRAEGWSDARMGQRLRGRGLRDEDITTLLESADRSPSQAPGGGTTPRVGADATSLDWVNTAPEWDAESHSSSTAGCLTSTAVVGIACGVALVLIAFRAGDSEFFPPGIVMVGGILLAWLSVGLLVALSATSGWARPAPPRELVALTVLLDIVLFLSLPGLLLIGGAFSLCLAAAVVSTGQLLVNWFLRRRRRWARAVTIVLMGSLATGVVIFGLTVDGAGPAWLLALVPASYSALLLTPRVTNWFGD